MMLLGGVERARRLDLGDDRSIEHVRLVQLGDVGFGNVGLLGIGRENGRAILGSAIRSLAVELGRIMGDRKLDLQNAAVADAVRVKSDADRLRVSSGAAADRLVMRCVGGPSGIAGDGAGDALNMLKDALDAPEATAGEDRHLGGCLCVRRFVECRLRD